MAQVPSNLIPLRVTQLPTAPVASEDSLMMVVYQGNNYQIRVGDLLSVAGVPLTRQVIAGTGMSGGGQLSSNVTLSIAQKGVTGALLEDTGVTAGVYGTATRVPVLTVDSTGRVTAANSIPVEVSGYVPETRQVIAGEGLTGGGTLNNNVTLSANLSDATPQVGDNAGSAGTATSMSRADHQHPAVDLADGDQVDGVLGLMNGGTANSLVPDAGAIIWCGADGLYVGPVGESGQVLVSSGTGEYTWGSAVIVTPQTANTFFAGPTSGDVADPLFRAMVNADLPDSGATPGSYGSALAIPVVTVNAKGVVTSITTTTFTGGLSYKGAWNASTNTPTLVSGTGTNGDYYVVSVAGSTNLDGITDWQIGDWALFNGTAWQKIDQSNSVSSVNGEVGAVVLDYADVGAPSVSGTNATGTWAIDISGNAGTVTNGVYTTGSYADPTWLTSLATSKLSGTVSNAQLANSSVTVNGNAVSLGGSTTITAVNPYALTIGTGLSGTSYDGSAAVTITNSAPDQTVVLTGGTGISTSGTYPSFTITNTAPDQAVVLTGAGTTTVTGTYPNFTITSNDTYSGTVTSVGTGTGLTGGPITSTGTVDFAVAAVGTWAATPSSANLAAAMTDETGSGKLVFADGATMSALTIDGSNPYVQFNNGSAVTVAAGKMWYNGSDGSWNLGMGGGNITQQVGEELFLYGKASAAITDSPLQIVYQTGVVGASGHITFAPTVSGITNGNLILGCATENIALNGFGRITTYGTIHGITTNGTAYGEVWADGDVIWYDPVTGNPTKTKPSAPKIKVQLGVVTHAGSGGSGSFFVLLATGTELGGTDSNVNITSPTGGQLLSYNQTAGYWSNIDLSAGTGISVTPAAGGSLTVANAGVTSFSAGATGFTPSTGTTGAVTLAGTLNVANGGTGLTSLTANYIPYGNGTGAYASSASLTYTAAAGLKAPQVNATNGLHVNSMTVSADYTVATGDSAFSIGPMTVASGVSVTVSSGSRWVVI